MDFIYSLAVSTSALACLNYVLTLEKPSAWTTSSRREVRPATSLTFWLSPWTTSHRDPLLPPPIPRRRRSRGFLRLLATFQVFVKVSMSNILSSVLVMVQYVIVFRGTSSTTVLKKPVFTGFYDVPLYACCWNAGQQRRVYFHPDVETFVGSRTLI